MANRRESSNLGPSTDIPDIMNDPSFDSNVKGKQKEDSDTCRICRGEGSAEEPLFYPCKCSGSIKFVHQKCLMEWLSHSQKKHCELCKTPFRFTKLYHPHMPKSVPSLIFLRQATVHSWKSLLAWSRMHLVIFVWLCWLPWSMRTVWRGLFWIGDGGWINLRELEEQALMANQRSSDQLGAEGAQSISHTVFTSKNIEPATMTSRLAGGFSRFWLPMLQTRSQVNRNSTIFTLAKNAFSSILGRGSPLDSNNSERMVNNPSSGSFLIYRSSWLSNVGFLKSLTRSPTINSLLIDTLEGQLITLMIVIAFILVFLIREWVIQQQPALNIPDVGARALPNQAEHNAALPQEEPTQQEEEPAEDPQADANALAEMRRTIAMLRERGDLEDPPSSEAPTDSQNRSHHKSQDEATVAEDITPGSERSGLTGLAPSLESPGIPQRPVMPGRDALARAAEIRRTIEEHAQNSGQDWPGLRTFKELWNRAESRPSEVLRIIEDEGRNEELGWIVTAMKKLEGLPSGTAVELSINRGKSSQSDLRDPQPRNAVTEVEAGTTLVGDLAESGRSISGPDSPIAALKPDSDYITILRRSPDRTVHRNDEGSIHSEEADAKENGSATVVPGSKAQPTLNVEQSDEELSTSQENGNAGNLFHPEYDGELPPSSILQPTPESSSQSHREILELDAGSHEHHVGIPIDSSDSHLRESSQQNNVVDAEGDFGLGERIMRWLWGEIRVMPPARPNDGDGDGDVERIVRNLAEEPPFVPMEHGQPVIEGPARGADNRGQGHQQENGQDQEVVAAAAQAGPNPGDAEAIEEAEDLEGIMELVGIQGPVAGLLQNGMFCALLVSLTIFLAVWIPYITGKVFLVFLANPVSFIIKLPLRCASSTADLVIDLVIFASSCSYYWIATVISFVCSPLTDIRPFSYIMHGEKLLAEAAKSYAEKSMERLTEAFLVTSGSLSESDIPTFSIIAHESLRLLQQCLYGSIRGLLNLFTALAPLQYIHSFDLGNAWQSLSTWQNYTLFATDIVSKVRVFMGILAFNARYFLTTTSSVAQVNLFRVSLSIPQRTHPLDFSLAYWDTKDRALAILFGYALFALIGVLYLQINYSMQGREKVAKVDGVVADVLYQAGGVIKVILIISIEMIAFPLYCGMLLDVALLPLFPNVTLQSRLDFMATSPYTSLFMHWFAGTCYMFHFALFVSMCRKLMRRGVLYFIRDPDDPTFHPVRDVLERSVFTQLWKIAFSALVYGGLVIICLGGVVWGIYSAFDGVFPIHWSSNEPVLEFPVDLLFYNFLMPLVVKYFKPVDGLCKVYGWWFKKCARRLRLSHFLFGERRRDEEGRHIRRTWNDVFSGKKGDPQNPVIGTDRTQLAENRKLDAYFLRDGRYVRTPASDQVRIPKGAHTFLEVDEEGNRIDGEPDSDQGLYGRNSGQFIKVYIPPQFRLRICAFIFLIWCFAATTGVSITIVPLVFGRHIFARIFPSHLRMNDVYAFSIGINLLGGTFYTLLNARRVFHSLRHSSQFASHLSRSIILQSSIQYTVRFSRVVYTYTAFAFLLPTLLSLLTEFYIIIPLHTYFGASSSDTHVIHVIQDWTLGVLYVQAISRLILWNADSRPANALRSIIRRGWLNPDVKIATRGFILPATVLILLLLITPLGLGWLVNRISSSAKEEEFTSAVYRYSYPGVLGLAMGVAFLRLLVQAFKGWRARIRDEVYLIGERLHNFGERRAGVRGTTRVRI
ncbi:MAG: hypothetical protein LQ342_005465 [Letrouitia transgressa]|nr:MAG: hypothetical protein LQ342_005465 [Letrouitia transgressa]